MKRLALVVPLIVAAFDTSATNISLPLPSGCTPVLTASGSDYVVSCSGGGVAPPVVPPTPPVVPPTPPVVPPTPTSCALPQLNVTLPPTGAAQISSGFGNGQVLVFSFTTGDLSTSYARITAAEYGGGPQMRHAELSMTPCGASLFAVNSQTVTIPFTVGPNNSGGYYPALHPQMTYYIMVTNVDGTGQATCQNGPCNMYGIYSPAH
jgi:hypothetical protein